MAPTPESLEDLTGRSATSEPKNTTVIVTSVICAIVVILALVAIAILLLRHRRNRRATSRRTAEKLVTEQYPPNYDRLKSFDSTGMLPLLDKRSYEAQQSQNYLKGSHSAKHRYETITEDEEFLQEQENLEPTLMQESLTPVSREYSHIYPSISPPSSSQTTLGSKPASLPLHINPAATASSSSSSQTTMAPEPANSRYIDPFADSASSSPTIFISKPANIPRLIIPPPSPTRIVPLSIYTSTHPATLDSLPSASFPSGVSGESDSLWSRIHNRYTMASLPSSPPPPPVPPKPYQSQHHLFPAAANIMPDSPILGYVPESVRLRLQSVASASTSIHTSLPTGVSGESDSLWSQIRGKFAIDFFPSPPPVPPMPEDARQRVDSATSMESPILGRRTTLHAQLLKSQAQQVRQTPERPPSTVSTSKGSDRSARPIRPMPPTPPRSESDSDRRDSASSTLLKVRGPRIKTPSMRSASMDTLSTTLMETQGSSGGPVSLPAKARRYLPPLPGS